MKKIRIASLYIVLIIAAMSVSSCVYHSRAPYHDNYGYGYRYHHPPRPIIVRPTPPPRVIYRDSPRRYRNDRRSYKYYNKQRNNRYGHNERSRGPR
ncbi:hypothetical protein SAMN04487995_3603 [Dyadobacter koreensis]|uniref:Lipoprotein n=1 Tax=Dyadobacter koreensis TaxID=408657 RepID=A0A1H6WNC4_9BACT|nr:hypothetical protein [Dyadobacter koreensis]SEJ17276.1 hypothetical protein SAMN04487995_3603 [Dyadobacter koreensis]